MRFVRGFLFAVFGLLLIGGLLSQVFKVQIGERLFERALTQQLQLAASTTRPDGLHIVLLGTGSPLGDPSRMGPSTAIIAGERVFIVDSGSGSPRNLGRFRVSPGQIERVFLTHFHSDHIDGLGELMLQRWTNGAHTSPLPIHGPEGIEQIVNGLNAAYAQDSTYRVAHHGERVVPSSGRGGQAVPFSSAQAITLIDDTDLKVTAFPVAHDPVENAVGYRFDYKGRSVTLSGDTAYSNTLITHATDSDLLISEALNTEMVAKIQARLNQSGAANLAKIMSDIPSYHITPVQAAQMAQSAGAEMLVLSHIVPAVPVTYLEAYYLKGAKDEFSGKLILGRDGMSFSLPAGSDHILRDTY